MSEVQFADLNNMIIVGDERAPVEAEKLLREGIAARVILDQALLPGMDEVGRRMKSGEAFIPEVLLSARTMQACLDVIRPELAKEDSDSIAKIVIGTVEGDLHDIGKNLVAMLLAGAGFEVINLGKGVTAEQFLAAVREHKPHIVAMSALLTTTVPRMSDVVKLLEESGLRDGVKVIVGGAPVTDAYAREIGADGYGANASLAVENCKALMSVRQ